jgi:hypothetical protein
MVERLSEINDSVDTHYDSLTIADISRRQEINPAEFEALMHEVLNLKQEL